MGSGSPPTRQKSRSLHRAAGRFFDPGPVGGDPVVDGGVVAFGRAAPWTLDGPAQPVAQDRPHMGRMVAHPGQPPDDQRDTVQGPQPPTNPLTTAPLRRACSTSTSWASD